MRTRIILLSLLLCFSVQLFAQNTYLVNKCKVIKSKNCTEDVGVVTVHGDGNKIFDEKIRGYEPPRVHTLNVAGVKELTVKIAATDIEVVVADAVLWKSGQKPQPEVPEVKPDKNGVILPAEYNGCEINADKNGYFYINESSEKVYCKFKGWTGQDKTLIIDFWYDRHTDYFIPLVIEVKK